MLRIRDRRQHVMHALSEDGKIVAICPTTERLFSRECSLTTQWIVVLKELALIQQVNANNGVSGVEQLHHRGGRQTIIAKKP